MGWRATSLGCIVAVAALAALLPVGGGTNVSATMPGSCEGYCGHSRTDNGEWSACGPCPRGERAVNGVCLECDGDVGVYTVGFFIFDATILGLLHLTVSTPSQHLQEQFCARIASILIGSEVSGLVFSGEICVCMCMRLVLETSCSYSAHCFGHRHCCCRRCKTLKVRSRQR
eukprot:m.158300 g.158300  ORF g.158300 m.158300 type:complete len:172 (+) comp14504_c0_seq5:57-572(+)